MLCMYVNMAATISFITCISNYSSECIVITVLFLLTLAFLSHFFNKKRSRKVFLLDFACYKPSSTLMCSKEQAVEQIRLLGNNDEKLLTLMKHGMYKAGLGDKTYLSEALLKVPPNPSMEEAKKEAEMVIFGAVDELFEKTNVVGKDIGILIVNCSLFNVVPSLCSMIVNHYKLRENIACYNLTGMGCSAGLIAISLSNSLLQVKHDQYALVVTTENITENCYLGKHRSKTSGNCVFRVGGAAILFSNRLSDRKLSKYELIQSVHINNASCDVSYNSIFQEEDENGLRGISISKDLLVAAKNAIELNLSMLGPLVLPLSEQVDFFKNLLVRRFLNPKVPRYIPKFSKCIEHFFPHVGGKPVLDELQKILALDDTVMEASRMSLYRFGNTSSSSVWYELAYAEAKGRVKKGDRLWQMAYGSGFKSNSIIWRATRSIYYEETNPWRGEIDEYPINLENIGELDPNVYYFETPVD